MFKCDSKFPSYRTVVITLALMCGASFGSLCFILTQSLLFSIVIFILGFIVALPFLVKPEHLYDFDEDIEDDN